MLKIYTDQQFIKAENRRCIFPLLFDLCYTKNHGLLRYYELVSKIEDSDIVIVPVDISEFFQKKQEKWLFEYIDKAHVLRKKVWVYSAGDFGITLDKEVYTFRLGGFNSKINDKTFILPSFINDPYDSFFRDKTVTIPKINEPLIGFVGNANGSTYKWIKEFYIFSKINFNRAIRIAFHDYQPFYPSSNKRFWYLKALQKSSNLKTNFIFRKKYRAGAKTDEQKKQTSLVFFDNIYNNPYTFCDRGVGNFSVRFYETLAMGRIPIVIDTDIRLPLNNLILWEEHCVIVTADNFEEKIIDFHKSIHETDFEKMQMNNRNLWLNYLNREAYFSQIHSIFKS